MDKHKADTVRNAVQNVFNLGSVKKAFRFSSEIFGAIQPVLEKRTPWSLAQSIINVGRVVVDELEIWPDQYFDDGWETPYESEFNDVILRAIAKHPFHVIKTSETNLNIHNVDLGGGVRLGYVINTQNGLVNAIYVESARLKEAKARIKMELWNLLKNDNIVLRATKNRRHNDPTIALEADDAFMPMASARAAQHAVYLKRCIDAGVSRSVMLYGPPGTGKSTMARTIVDTLSMKSFRIRVEDIGHLETSTIFEAINIFEPDAVILDDFDRAGSQMSLLETLEYFQRHVKLVIATVNDRNSLDEAVLRPGRFDELMCIKQMDEDVVRAVLGSDHADAFDTVKNWPIAFIQEYVKRRKFMSLDEAAQSVVELAQRVKRLDKYDDVRSDIDIVAASKRPRKRKKSSPTPEEQQKIDDFVAEIEAKSKLDAKRK